MRLFHIVATLFAVSSFALASAGCAADTDGNDPGTNEQQVTQGDGANDLSRIHASTDLSRFEKKTDRAQIDDPSVDYRPLVGDHGFEEKLGKLPAERREAANAFMGQD